MKELALKIHGKIKNSKHARMAASWTYWFASSWILDDLIYPLVIALLGPLFGGVIMTVLLTIIAWFWLKAIVSTHEEWFGMKTMHKIQKIVFWIMRITKHIPFIKHQWVDKIEHVTTFLLLNFVFDPIITVLYFRRDEKVKRISKKDKVIFVWSSIVSNLYWTLRSWGIVLIIRYVWKIFV